MIGKKMVTNYEQVCLQQTYSVWVLKRLGPIFSSHTTALEVSVFGIGIGIVSSHC